MYRPRGRIVLRKPLEARHSSSRVDAASGYDGGRRAACSSLLSGPVRGGAARRLVELVLAPRDHRDELWEIFEATDNLTAVAPTLEELTAVAARATAAHTCRGERPLGASVAAIAAGIDRRFSACESGQAGYPLSLTGLGAAGRYGVENNLSPVYLTHALERIVEATVFVCTVIEPACAPGAYVVSREPRSSTRAAVRRLLTDCLVRDQNAAIDFALEELGDRLTPERVAFDHLQDLMLALRAPVDVGQLVVGAHALLSSESDELEIGDEVVAAAQILDGSGLTGEGSLALGEAVGAITSLTAGLVCALHGHGTGGGAVPEELARSVLRVAPVIAWCADHGRVRPGAITLDDRHRLRS